MSYRSGTVAAKWNKHVRCTDARESITGSWTFGRVLGLKKPGLICLGVATRSAHLKTTSRPAWCLLIRSPPAESTRRDCCQTGSCSDCAWSTKGCSRIQSRRKVPGKGKGALCGLHGCSRESNVSFLAGLHCEAAPFVAGPFWQPGLLFCLLMARTFEVVLWFFVILYFFRYIILFFLWNLDNFIFGALLIVLNLMYE